MRNFDTERARQDSPIPERREKVVTRARPAPWIERVASDHAASYDTDDLFLSHRRSQMQRSWTSRGSQSPGNVDKRVRLLGGKGLARGLDNRNAFRLT